MAIFSSKNDRSPITKEDPPIDAAFSSLVERVQHHATLQPQKIVYTYLNDGENDATEISYEMLDREAKRYAAFLQDKGLKGERILLLYPQGYQFIIALWGCLYAGAIAIPAYPPKRNQSFLRLKNIIHNSNAKLIATTESILPRITSFHASEKQLREMAHQTHEQIMENRLAYRPFLPQRTDLAFLQYTSGSTGAPKGVMVSHGNILANCQQLKEGFRLGKASISVHWLPIFHDMGLVFGIFSPVYTDYHSVLMPPISFIQKPLRWFRAFQQYNGTIGGAPNFAYDLLATKVTEEEKASLDLSGIVTLYNGAEPARQQTHERLMETYKSVQLNTNCLTPAYGMAETTLHISSEEVQERAQYLHLDRAAYQEGKVSVVPKTAKGYVVASVGRPCHDMKVVIVNPETLSPCKKDEVGEIWISGSSVTQGYWNNSTLTQETFGAHIAATHEEPYLRTGDMGFIWKQKLYVSGRLKDLIIINGANHYPQDIELATEQSDPCIYAGNTAAFSVDAAGKEQLVVVAEVRRTALRRLDTAAVMEKIRQAILTEFEIAPFAIILIRTMSIPKTSSGKISRHQCKEAYLRGELAVVGAWEAETAWGEAPETASPMGETMQWLFQWIEQKMRIPASRLDPDHALSQYPLDSITAIELAADLSNRFNVRINPEEIFQAKSLQEITELIDNA
ncbi:MAG: AMP-dependent synthetase [Bacteroidetes bacterium]|nr:MAG: AMP-dependent synthetase [Bacteroidota bacterium]